jgi:hypothetical protein
VIQIGKVRIIESITKIQVAINLLKTTLHKATGKVINSSIVPRRFSSDQLFIVTAGIKKIKTHGKKLKKVVRSATPELKKFPK